MLSVFISPPSMPMTYMFDLLMVSQSLECSVCNFLVFKCSDLSSLSSSAGILSIPWSSLVEKLGTEFFI